MALKDIFTMVKADRYTADGREELNKAREADVEDRTYQIGEISEKTGLQKTAQGWKPPKETKFGKVKQNKEGQWGVQTKQGKGSGFLKHKSEKEASRALANYTAGYNTTERSKQDPHSDQARQIKHWDKETEKIRKQNRAEGRAAHAAQFQKPVSGATNGDKWQKNTDYLGRERISMETPQGGKVSIYESSNPKQKNARFRVDTGDHYNEFNTMEEAKAFAEEQYGRESKPDATETSKAEKIPHNFSRGDRYKNKYGENIDIDEIDEDTISYTKTNVDGSRETHEMPVEKFKTMLKGEEFSEGSNSRASRMKLRANMEENTDSAPRVLTGDTRIRVRK